MNLRSTHINQRGVSLVELMIAMLLGLFLMIGVIQVFVSSKSTYNTQESLSRVQESGRHAVSILSRDLRMAGFTGCGGQTASFNNRLNVAPGSTEDFIHNFTSGIFGSEAQGTAPNDTIDFSDGDTPAGGWDPALPDDTGHVEDGDDLVPLPGSDVFMVRGQVSGLLSASTSSGNPIGQAASFGVDGMHDLEQGDIIIVSDCANTTMLQITNNVQQSDNVANAAGCGQNDPCNLNPSTWDPEDFITGDATVAKVEAAVYFVANNEDDVPTLYRQVLSGNPPPRQPQVIAEGVENMQVLYGTRAAGTALEVDQFRTAAQIETADLWDEVIAVQVSLLVRDEDRLPEGIADRARTFTLGGYDLTVAPDGLQRQIFRATVTLRNRAL